MAPHFSTLAWRLPWTEEPGRLQSMGSLRVGHVPLRWGETQGHLGVTGGAWEAEDRGGAVHGRGSF